MKYLAWIGIGVSLFVGCKSDLRLTKKEYKEDHYAKGRAMLEKAAQANGVENWKKLASYDIEFEDTFYTPAGKIGCPFKENGAKMSINYVPFTDDGTLQINSGKQAGTIWKLKDWKSFVKKPDGELEEKKHKNTSFWVPTYKYFIEMPNRITEASQIYYEKDSVMDGVEYQIVLASWNTLKPQRKIDQYRLWIEKKSGRLLIADYTIRDFYSFIWGRTFYKDWKNFEGFDVATHMEVHSSLNMKKIMHSMRIHDFKPTCK